jgi:alcohol dehydrogenase (NADP+)
VFEGLHAAGTKPTDRVAIVGLGGLGHIAVMYARAMGCEVVVLSGRQEKKEDAMALGATDFHLLGKDDAASVGTPAKINVVLLCGGSLSDLGLYALCPSQTLLLLLTWYLACSLSLRLALGSCRSLYKQSL